MSGIPRPGPAPGWWTPAGASFEPGPARVERLLSQIRPPGFEQIVGHEDHRCLAQRLGRDLLQPDAFLQGVEPQWRTRGKGQDLAVHHRAVGQEIGELRQLRSGDRVYLGRIANVDPTRARVVVDYNRGGIRERVEIDLETGERYRQALGRQTLSPSRGSVPAGPTLDAPPPAPGTPEAIEAGTYQSAEITPRTPQN